MPLLEIICRRILPVLILQVVEPPGGELPQGGFFDGFLIGLCPVLTFLVPIVIILLVVLHRPKGPQSLVGLELDLKGEACRVVEVIPGSPAKAAGFVVGDVVLKFNGQLPSGPKEVVKWLRQMNRGEAVPVDVRRGQEVLTLTLVFGNRPSPSPSQGQGGPGSSVTFPTEQELRAFVGPNSDYYLRKWQPSLQGQGGTGAHFAIFCLGPLWLSYRKMHLAALALMAIWVAMWVVKVLALLGGLWKSPEGMNLLTGMNLILPIVIVLVCCFRANSWYLSRAQRVIGKVRSLNLPEASHLEELSRRGRTSFVAPLLFALLIGGLHLMGIL